MQKQRTWMWYGIGILLLTLTIGFNGKSVNQDVDWPEYQGDAERSHYSVLNNITPQNIKNLKVAWTYASGGADTVGNRSQMQCNPIIIKGILYGVSADTQAFALDAATGEERWKTKFEGQGGMTSRGVTYWSDGKDERIFFGLGKWVYALDAKTGKVLSDFGTGGRIDLKTGVERPGADDYIRSNTPNTIYKNLLIVGARVSENEFALLGDIRAYDTRSGALVWTFHTIPKPGEFGYSSWQPANPRERLGGANAWAGMAIDRDRGIVYIPTGSAAFDFYGGNRTGDNLYANCLLALDAATGKRLWHFQLVHHDIWDRDPPTTPNLVTVLHQGKKVDAVAQITKQGQVFVFNRVTGEPLFPIDEKSFDYEAMPGETTAKTQPIPRKPAPFTRQSFTEKDINPWSKDKVSIAQTLKTARTGSPYIPITGQMTLFFPGTDGGAQWGGAASDPEGVLYIPAKENPCFSSLVPIEQAANPANQTGKELYSRYCSACHGNERQGNHDGSYPSLVGIGSRLSPQAIRQVLEQGKGMMPSFSHISEQEKKAILDFLSDKKSISVVAKSNSGRLPYKHTGYNRWYDQDGYPVSAPPWGTLTAIDLNTGEHKWQVPLGEYKELTERGIAPTGTDNYGGPLVTSSGLLFIAATKDEQFRAFDRLTGKILWQTQLPFAGYATPATYSVNGKQYVVIACGGGKLKSASGDVYVAYALD
ncbi:pyrroloquinoline quinone-dependent dehydrogenase [Arundinibacter roseus]|uniref:C-type cytochrome n=1 Tax=Arundinibacter roseus TaxID=2070510 RepID=A0A4R4KK68_9BACT|nr:pyrroloquinoline quinone-dependent dehydrogenase [Arundinibacter roseus]TDB67312.1 c-type cytochrome [Arundinibacter roseus]